jgi:hypothetical protein
MQDVRNATINLIWLTFATLHAHLEGPFKDALSGFHYTALNYRIGDYCIGSD